MRAISTVFDVTLCLLLVSASAFVLVGVQSPRAATADSVATPAHESTAESSAESTATVLATSTATVNYTIRSGRGALPRTTHDTLAGLLADAAVTNATAGGTELLPTSDGFEGGVASHVRTRLAVGSETRTHIVVRWKPYRDAHLGGRFAVGSPPPRDATVRAATLSVPSGLPTVRSDAIDAARRERYRGVARVVATGIVAGFLPRPATEIARRDRLPVAVTVENRRQRLRRQYDIDRGGTRRELVRATTAAIESDLRSTFETPEAAAKSVAVGRAKFVVRTWSP